jgi:hypothetical protein
MPDTASSVLTAWSNFYVIAGSSAAALTGLMFVVITLVVGLERSKRTPDGVATFSTPTVVHFCVALVISAILSAPWHSLARVGVALGLTGLYGIVYVLRVFYRTRRLTVYRPELEDWLWYTVLPFVSYVAIVVSAILLPTAATRALFALAGAVVLLVLIGIHNAWDVVTYLALQQGDQPPSSSPNEEEGRASEA